MHTLSPREQRFLPNHLFLLNTIVLAFLAKLRSEEPMTPVWAEHFILITVSVDNLRIFLTGAHWMVLKIGQVACAQGT